MSTKWFFLFFCPLALLVLPGSAPHQQSTSIEGSWKLVHMTTTQNAEVVGGFPESWSGNDMKIWSHGHFAFVGRMKIDTAYTDFYGGGKYALKGNRYEETIEFHVSPSLIGTTVRMLLEVRNDTLTQTWPVKENGEIDRENFTEEQYVRMD